MKNHFGTVGWIFRVTGKSKYGIFALTALETLESLSSVLFALLLKNVIDCATSGDSRGFLFAMVQLAVLIVLQILIRTIIRRCTEGTKSMAENSLRLHLYEVCLTREYAALSEFHTGELQNRIISDSAVVAEGMVSIVPGVTAMVVKLIGSATVLMAIDYRFTLIFIAGGIMLVLAVAAMRRVMKRMHKRVQTADGAVRSYLQETLGNLMVLRSFSAEKHATQAAAQQMNYHRQERMRRNTVSCAGNAGIAAVMNAGYLFGLIWGGTGILRGVVSYGTLAAILQLVNQIQAPFVNMSSYLPTYFAMLASAERLLELEQLPAENTADRLTQQQRDAQYAAMEAIHVENITFTYPDDDAAVLTNASITIPKGAFVAITGRSGIGKSTLLKLLLSVFMPQEGSISLVRSDGTAIPVTASVRPMFAYVPQGNCLMSGTIAEAIRFAMPDEKDEEKLRAACEIACVDFIGSLPNGLDTKIGEKGSGLSEGQLQRLSIARAIYCGAPILLLDEATSALDAQTEEQLLANLRHLTDKTVLIVTHRPAALAICDMSVEINGKQFKV